MNILGVLKNIKKNGIAGTLEIKKENKKKSLARQTALKNIEVRMAELETSYQSICSESIDSYTNQLIDYAQYVISNMDVLHKEDVCRAFIIIGTFLSDFRDDRNGEINFTELSKLAKTVQQTKSYRAVLKKLYIQEIIPEVYSKESQAAVDNKIIFMESGHSPSPTCQRLGQVLEAQGKYKIIYTGLRLREIPSIEYYANAIKFIRDAATAKLVCLSTANDLLSHFDVRPETKVIQLWHGVGVFKKIGWSTVDNQHFGKGMKQRLEYDQYRNYYAVTIAAESQSFIFEEAMRLDKSKIRPIGVARTDVFYDQSYIDEQYNMLYSQYPAIKGKKIILYAPTFRGSVINAQAPDQLDIGTMARALGDEYVLLIKHHGLAKNVPQIQDTYRDKFAYDIGESKVLGIEGLLSIADICITDYSSIAFEYSIMERPMIFFAYDLEDYIDKRGMYYDYDEITPGPICKTTDEIVDYIQNIDTRFDKQEVIDFKNKHVGMCDGHSIERTIALMEE